jgi:hypothetical protein
MVQHLQHLHLLLGQNARITANTTIKALVVKCGLLAVKSEVYFVSVPTLTVYFKPPTTWTGATKSSLLECRSWWEVLLVQLGLVLLW